MRPNLRFHHNKHPVCLAIVSESYIVLSTQAWAVLLSVHLRGRGLTTIRAGGRRRVTAGMLPRILITLF